MPWIGRGSKRSRTSHGYRSTHCEDVSPSCSIADNRRRGHRTGCLSPLQSPEQRLRWLPVWDELDDSSALKIYRTVSRPSWKHQLIGGNLDVSAPTPKRHDRIAESHVQSVKGNHSDQPTRLTLMLWVDNISA